jgi:hypothetical protein
LSRTRHARGRLTAGASGVVDFDRSKLAYPLLEPPVIPSTRLPQDAKLALPSSGRDESPHEGEQVEGEIARHTEQRDVLLREHKGMPVRMVELITTRKESTVPLNYGVPWTRQDGSPSVLNLGKHPEVVTEPHAND